MSGVRGEEHNPITLKPHSLRLTALLTTDKCGHLASRAYSRKEVIQPHLPIRLPCYDFVPLAPHTFDGSLSCELGHRLRVQTTQVT